MYGYDRRQLNFLLSPLKLLPFSRKSCHKIASTHVIVSSLCLWKSNFQCGSWYPLRYAHRSKGVFTHITNVASSKSSPAILMEVLTTSDLPGNNFNICCFSSDIYDPYFHMVLSQYPLHGAAAIGSSIFTSLSCSCLIWVPSSATFFGFCNTMAHIHWCRACPGFTKVLSVQYLITLLCNCWWWNNTLTEVVDCYDILPVFFQASVFALSELLLSYLYHDQNHTWLTRLCKHLFADIN